MFNVILSCQVTKGNVANLSLRASHVAKQSSFMRLLHFIRNDISPHRCALRAYAEVHAFR
jgi:hypothetical protein